MDIYKILFYGLIVLIVCLIIKSLDLEAFSNKFVVVPTEDRNNYNVLENYKNKEDAAKMLEMINKSVLKVIAFMKKQKEMGEYKQSPYTEGVVSRILQNWNPERIYENPPDGSDGTSYTVSKGEKTVFCLRYLNSSRLHAFDDIFFVALHELAHMGDLKWGHNQSFWEVFKFILEQATLSGEYVPYDYSINPINYCGLHVAYNPYFDKNIPAILDK